VKLVTLCENTLEDKNTLLKAYVDFLFLFYVETVLEQKNIWNVRTQWNKLKAYADSSFSYADSFREKNWNVRTQWKIKTHSRRHMLILFIFIMQR